MRIICFLCAPIGVIVVKTNIPLGIADDDDDDDDKRWSNPTMRRIGAQMVAHCVFDSRRLTGWIGDLLSEQKEHTQPTTCFVVGRQFRCDCWSTRLLIGGKPKLNVDEN